MDVELYFELLKQLKQSATKFLGKSNQKLTDEIDEDFKAIINIVKISEWKCNADGTSKNVSQLLIELEKAILNNDKQKCIESIAMLRVAISNIETAFSNAVDSMEKLIVTIRDCNPPEK